MSKETEDEVPKILMELVGQVGDRVGQAVRMLREAREASPPDLEKIARAEAILLSAPDALADANSAMPETRAFLEARGLTSINQLDKAGRIELRTHLEQTLAALTAGNSPA